MYSILPLWLLLCYISGIGGFSLFVRTDRSISVVDVNEPRKTGTVRTIFNISQDIPVLLAANVRQQKGLFVIRNILYRADLKSSQVDELGRIDTGLEHVVTSFAVDPVTLQNYIWIAGNGHVNSARVVVCAETNITDCTTILHKGLDYGHSLSLDPNKGEMFWLNSITSNIEMSSMDGSAHDRKPFKSFADLNHREFTVSSLVFHQPTDSLLVLRSRGSASEIWQCFRQKLCSIILRQPQVVHIGVSQNKLWWTSSKGELMTCILSSCSITVTMIAISLPIETFVVLDPALQNYSGESSCSISNGGCSHRCLLKNSAPFSKCACSNGIPFSSKNICDSRGVDRVLLVTALSGLFKIAIDAEDFVPQAIIFEGYEQVTKLYDVDFDPVDRKVYWIDAERGFIRRCSLDGSHTEDVLSVPLSVKVFRLDHVNRNIYWINSQTARIHVTRLNTAYSKVLHAANLVQPQGLAIDSINGRLYFSDCDEMKSRIEISSLDGSQRSTIISLMHHAYPNGLVISNEFQKLFWTEGNASVIQMASLDGSNVEVVGPQAQDLLQPYSITMLDDTMFTNSLSLRTITKVRFRKHNGASFYNLESPIYGPIGLKAISLYAPTTTTSTCATHNPCQHICITSSGAVKCLCAERYELQKDNRSCVLPKEFLIFSQDSSIYRISTNMGCLHLWWCAMIPICCVLLNKDQSSIVNALAIENLSTNLAYLDVWEYPRSPQSLDFDQQSQFLYTADSWRGGGAIRRHAFNGDIETVVNGTELEGIRSIAFDFISHNIYWINPRLGTIEVTNGIGSFKRTLVWRNRRPRLLAIYPPHRVLLYVDGGFNNTIRRIGLNGDSASDLELIANLDTVVALSIDIKKERVYWTERFQNVSSLSLSNIDGSDREKVLVTTEHSLDEIYAHNGLVYFVDRENARISRFDGTVVEVLHSGISDIRRLIMSHSDVLTDSNECSATRLLCPELCLSSGSPVHKKSCFCRDHFHYESSGECKGPDDFVVVGSKDEFIFSNLRKDSSRKSLTWKEDIMVSVKDERIGSPHSVAFDFVTGLLFWIDTARPGDIRFMSRKNQQQIRFYKDLDRHSRHNCSKFLSLAMDDYGRQLFVSCQTFSYGRQIVVFRVQAESPSPLQLLGTVISNESPYQRFGHVPEPRDIAVFPALNYLFYVDSSPQLESPTIVQCSLDGRLCERWYPEQSRDLWPLTSIYADPANLRLFYTCPSGIWSRDVGAAASNVIHHYKNKNASNFAVAPVDELRVIVAEITQSFTRVVDLLDNELLMLPNETLSLHRFGPSVANSPCDASPCSHICRFVRDSKQRYQCACPLGFVIDLNNDNRCVERVRCESWEFACDDGRTCIHAASKCDRIVHCRDGSDEYPQLCRSLDLWPCDDRTEAVKRTEVCDGTEDCADGSDERHCRCSNPRGQFDCSALGRSEDYECISRKHVCNGLMDCEHGEDESVMICADFATMVDKVPFWVKVIYALLMVLLVLFLISIAMCCWRACKPPAATSTISTNPTQSTEARMLLTNCTNDFTTQFDVLDMAVRSRSAVASTSSYPSLPPPNSLVSHGAESILVEIPLRQCYAPPPSAVSLSTYGVVKPSTTRRISYESSTAPRLRNHLANDSVPPPEYTMVDQDRSDVHSRLSDGRMRPPLATSTPMRYQSLGPGNPYGKGGQRYQYEARKTPPARRAHSQGTRQRAPLVQRMQNVQSGAVVGTATTMSGSSSSLSSHSSEEGFVPKEETYISK